jgi:hypothetical protein
MSDSWAASAPMESAPALARLELPAQSTVCVDSERLWLRGSTWSESLDRKLRSIIGCERYMIAADDAIVPAGKRLSCGNLPTATWVPLSTWIELTIPPRMFVASTPAPVRLSLVRSEQEYDASMLRTSLAGWTRYAASAPQVRLQRWKFAVSDDGSVLVQGTPLPPLPGQRYSVIDGIAAPVGWTWRPALNTAVIRQCLGLKRDDLALLTEEKTWEKLSDESFVAATRSAVRLTAEALT